LRLKRHTTADKYLIQDYTDNWNVLDANPGIFVCTSTTNPTTWTTADLGRMIHETDTGLVWRWDGSRFLRLYAVGDLGSAQITEPVQTTSTSLVDAVTLDVTVPRGDRAVMVYLSGPGVYNTNGLTRLALFRGATQIQSWLSHGRLTGEATDQPRPISMSIRDTPAAGPTTYSLRYSAEVGYAGTSHLQAAIDAPLRLSVVEI